MSHMLAVFSAAFSGYKEPELRKKQHWENKDRNVVVINMSFKPYGMVYLTILFYRMVQHGLFKHPF